MRYAVIGAGVLGLTLGLRLQQQGHHVLILDQGTVPGGLASSFEVAPGIWLERFYHHLFQSDRHAIALIDELGLAPRLRWHRPETTVTVDGVPRRLDSPTSLLRFAALPLVDRLRTGVALAGLRLLPSPTALARSSADTWMRRASGPRGHETVWEPLLRAKFGASYRAVSMAWLWARLHDRTAALGYMDGGFHHVYAALESAFTDAGGEVQYGATVHSIGGEAGSLEVAWTLAGDGSSAPARIAQAERVVSTLPPAVTARLAPALADWGRARGGPHSPLSAHCLVLELDRPLTGTYWIGATGRSDPFLAVVEHTAMLSPDAYGGRHLLYLGAYRSSDDEWLALPPDEQLARAAPFLRSFNAHWEASWVRRSWSFTAPNAQPIVDTGYRERIPPLNTPMPGVYCASMFHVYPHDRGQNYSIALAEELANQLEGAAR